MENPEDTIAQLREATEHRTTIGVALGILMERYSITQEAAFSLLRRESSSREQKLYDLAVALRTTGQLPKRGPGPRPDA